MAQVSRRVSDAFSALRQIPERVADAFVPYHSEENAATWSSPYWTSPQQRTASVHPLSAKDATALAKVVQSEIGHWPDAELDRAVGPHVASILNRVTAPGYPKTVEGVVNQNQQYSAINPLGHWDLLPDAPSGMNGRVENTLYEMAMGRPHTKSTHFLNPNEVLQKHLDRWGNMVVAEATRDGEVFGFPPNDAHYMGTDYSPAPPGYVTAEEDFRIANGMAPPGALFGPPEAALVDSGRFVTPPGEPVQTGRNSAKGATRQPQKNTIQYLKKLAKLAR